MLDVIVENAGTGNGGETSTETSETTRTYLIEVGRLLFATSATDAVRTSAARALSPSAGAGPSVGELLTQTHLPLSPTTAVQIHQQRPWT